MGDANGLDRACRRLRDIATFTLLGAVAAGCFGHDGDSVQWASAVVGAWAGGLIVQ